MVQELNAVDEQSTVVNRDYTREVMNRQLREMADTSSFALVSLYALWHSDYREHQAEDPAWFRAYLKKWREEDSPYFDELRQEVGRDRNDGSLGILLGILMVLVLLLLLMIRSHKRNTHPDQIGPDLRELTVQERKVYALLREGYSNKEIAGDLAVSVSTVKTHVNNIFSKLGVTSRKEILDQNGY